MVDLSSSLTVSHNQMVHEIPWVKSSKAAPLAARLLSNQEEFRNLALELVPGAGLVGH
jgi:hypothetical protein